MLSNLNRIKRGKDSISILHRITLILKCLITTQQTRLGMSRKPKLSEKLDVFRRVCYIKNYSRNRIKIN